MVIELGTSRVGFVVPKHGQTAVRRNLLKRRLRDWARLEMLPRLGTNNGVQAIDVVIRARQPAYRAPEPALRQDFDRLVAAVTRFAATRR